MLAILVDEKDPVLHMLRCKRVHAVYFDLSPRSVSNGQVREEKGKNALVISITKAVLARQAVFTLGVLIKCLYCPFSQDSSPLQSGIP